MFIHLHQKIFNFPLQYRTSFS